MRSYDDMTITSFTIYELRIAGDVLWHRKYRLSNQSQCRPSAEKMPIRESPRGPNAIWHYPKRIPELLRRMQ
ncbi:hypothetical protein CC78DRAFT_348460 [Lojkania enalia]|uniref:Uncharacterized protein n=1 Tax=Lojkania enalia TaxID=147567 RepID=A0A9P4N1F5_9PLEO|nr:hypothetical protein CC78DRAFT_348460 [Didymosphaeria enalia]